MKKVLIILIILFLCGCHNVSENKETSFEDIGYSKEDIEIINTINNEEIIEMFKSKYDVKLVQLIHDYDFKQENIEKYIKYLDIFEVDDVVRYVNGDVDMDEIIELRKNEYYISKNEELYLSCLSEYDSIRDCIEAVNTKTNYPYYTNIVDTDTSKNYLMLINKYHCLSSDYEPDDLVDIDPYYGRGQTRAEVYENYKKMADDAFELGYDFVICSAYRSYDYQYGLYNKYLNIDEGGQASVDTYSARPGHSEHQSGLCLDLSDAVYGMDDFGLSDASKWINENCYKYGFIIRYTEEKEKITGYQAEPWQVRYVGDVSIAKDIMDRNITFDEYYACFIENE